MGAGELLLCPTARRQLCRRTDLSRGREVRRPTRCFAFLAVALWLHNSCELHQLCQVEFWSRKETNLQAEVWLSLPRFRYESKSTSEPVSESGTESQLKVGNHPAGWKWARRCRWWGQWAARPRNGSPAPCPRGRGGQSWARSAAPIARSQPMRARGWPAEL